MSPNNERSFFFAVKNIIKPFAAKLIYNIRYNNLDYFILKTLNGSDCEQLDSNPRIAPDIFTKICNTILEVEKEYKKTPPLELINIEIFKILLRLRDPDPDED